MLGAYWLDFERANSRNVVWNSDVRELVLNRRNCITAEVRGTELVFIFTLSDFWASDKVFDITLLGHSHAVHLIKIKQAVAFDIFVGT